MAGTTITQRIALIGSEEIKQQLKSLGDAGAAAFAKLQFAVSGTGIGQALDNIKVRAAAIADSARGLGQSFNNLGRATEFSARRFAVAATAVAGLSGGFEFLVKGASDAAEQIENLADSVGMTQETFQRLSGAAAIAGLDQEQFGKAMKKMNSAVDEQAKQDLELEKKQRSLMRQLNLGRISWKQYDEQLQDMNYDASQSISVFSRLGVVIEKNNDGSINSEKLLRDLADALKAMPEGAERSALAMAAFGSRNAKMMSFVKQGAKGIDDLVAALDKLAPPMNKLQREGLGNLNDAFDRLKLTTSSLRMAFAAVLAPGQQKVVDALTEAFARNRIQILGIASMIADKMKPAIDAVVTALEGDAMGRFFETASTAVMDFATAVKTAFTGIIIPAFMALLTAAQSIADVINTVFGTNFTGGTLIAAAVILNLVGAFSLLSAAGGVVASAVGLVVAAIGALPAILIGASIAIGTIIGLWIRSLGGWRAAWQQLLNWTKSQWDSFAGAISSAVKDTWNAIVAVFSPDALMTFFTSLGAAIVAFFVGLPDMLAESWASFLTSMGMMWNDISSLASNAAAAITSAFSACWQAIIGGFQSAWSTVTGWMDSLIEKVKSVASAVSSLFSSGGSAGGGGGFAAGGYIRGPGSSRSDSIPAWLSNGEFVQQARAVGKYGVAFMEALNRGLISSDAVRSLMNGFSMGGLVDSLSLLVPRRSFADGGLAGAGASSMQPVNINIGGEVFAMQAEHAVVSKLTRYATTKAVRRAGRRPGWFGG